MVLIFTRTARRNKGHLEVSPKLQKPRGDAGWYASAPASSDPKFSRARIVGSQRAFMNGRSLLSRGSRESRDRGRADGCRPDPAVCQAIAALPAGERPPASTGRPPRAGIPLASSESRNGPGGDRMACEVSPESIRGSHRLRRGHEPTQEGATMMTKSHSGRRGRGRARGMCVDRELTDRQGRRREADPGGSRGDGRERRGRHAQCLAGRRPTAATAHRGDGCETRGGDRDLQRILGDLVLSGPADHRRQADDPRDRRRTGSAGPRELRAGRRRPDGHAGRGRRPPGSHQAAGADRSSSFWMRTSPATSTTSTSFCHWCVPGGWWWLTTCSRTWRTPSTSKPSPRTRIWRRSSCTRAFSGASV